MRNQALKRVDNRLYDWQRDDVAWLEKRLGAIIAHDMGVGKTVITLKLIESLGYDHNLVIAPKPLIGHWLRQAELWTDLVVTPFKTDGGVTIVNYERVRDYFDDYDLDWGVVAVDEAQRIKNEGTQTTQACRSLRAKRRYALTATPIENDIQDLYSICKFIGNDIPHQVTGINGQVLLHPKTKIQKQIARAITRKSRFREQVVVQLGDLMIRRRIDDVVGLSPVMVKRIEVTLNPQELRTYVKFENEFQVYISDHNFSVPNALVRLTRLRQICNGIPTLLGEPGTSTKIEQVLDSADNIVGNGHKLIIFSEFLGMVSILVDGLRGLGHVVGELSGRVQDYDEEKAKDWDIMVCTKAGEHGHDLQQASYVMNVDLPYNPARVMQRIGRARRIGQENPVVLLNFIVTGSVEERILKIIYEKRKEFYEVIEKGVSMDRDLIYQIGMK